MLRPREYRPCRLLIALGLVVVGFLSLPGCGGKPSATSTSGKVEKPADPAGSPSAQKPSTSTDTQATGSPAPPAPPPAAPRIDLKDAEQFVAAIRGGSVKADRLSTRFVKAIGLPVSLAPDKAKGYSVDAAEGWLKRAGAGHNLSAFLQSKQVADVAMFTGVLGDGSGSYALRMIQENGGWKVDWLSLSSTKVNGASINTAADEIACQQFAVAATIGVLLDREAMSKEDRAEVLAAGLTPALKTKWAEPLGSDRNEGFDYNRGLLAQKASEFARDADSFTLTAVPGTSDYRVEVARRNGSKTAYLVKLVKGPGPCLWLVDDVIPH